MHQALQTDGWHAFPRRMLRNAFKRRLRQHGYISQLLKMGMQHKSSNQRGPCKSSLLTTPPIPSLLNIRSKAILLLPASSGYAVTLFIPCCGVTMRGDCEATQSLRLCPKTAQPLSPCGNMRWPKPLTSAHPRSLDS